jgi:hypothetical protein
MLHSKRRWCVAPVGSAEELAHKLTETTWCGCTGFRIGEYLWLNDSTSPDGAQEFAVVKEIEAGRWVQLESITFGWCDYERSLELILATLNGQDDRNSWRKSVHPILDAVVDHQRCLHCA